MHLPIERLYTTEDIYSLPEGERAELVDGQIYYMAPPGRKHQEIIAKFTQIISNYIDSKNGDCKVYPAPFAVFLNADNKTYVEPDISVVCDRNKLDDYGCNGAPDWVIEIVSPSSVSMDYSTKLFKYCTAKVREYWIVDYAKNIINVYNFETGQMKQYGFSDAIVSSIFPDLIIDFSQLAI